MLKNWADGTYSEYVLTLPTVLTRLDGLDHLPSERLAYLSKFAIPLGGLLRGDLRSGQTLIVNGATGYFGGGCGRGIVKPQTTCQKASLKKVTFTAARLARSWLLPAS